MDAFSRLDMPYACHADVAAYIHAMRWIMYGVRGDWSATDTLEPVCRAKRFNQFYLVKDVDD